MNGGVRVKVLVFEWGKVSVNKRKLVRSIVGVRAVAVGDRIYEFKKPVPIEEWTRNCKKIVPGNPPEYVCNEDYVYRLLAL
jgi:hypothetical protein